MTDRAENVRLSMSARKKRRVRAAHHAPFPVPIRSLTLDIEEERKWWYYSSQLIGSSVVVNNNGDIHHLYNMGFFGKGNLSRSGVEYKKYFQTSPKDESGGRGLPVMKRQRYIRHLNWQQQKESEGSGGLGYDESREYDSDEENNVCIEGPEHGKDTDRAMEIGMDAGCSASVKLSPLECTGEGLPPFVQLSSDWVSLASEQEVERDFKKRKTDDWDCQEADAEFWGSVSNNKPESSKKSENIGGGDEVENCVETDESFSQSNLLNKNKDLCENQGLSMNSRSTRNKLSLNISNAADNNFGSDKKVAYNKNSQNNLQGCKVHVDSSKLTPESATDFATGDKTDSHIKSSEDGIKASVSGKTCFMEESSESLSSTSGHLLGSGDDQTSNTHQDMESDRPRRPMEMLGSADPDGDVLVVSDTEVSEDQISQKADICRRGVVKKDPYKMTEHLQLSLEEAFFLSYGLGCLVCQSAEKVVMDITTMWRMFSSMKSAFVSHYVAYHHFRSKGWVPKSGVKFGVDYILYKEGPPFYHASYSVVVRLVNDATLTEDPEFMTQPLTWRSLSGLNRITENVAKELMFCFVVKPASISEEELTSPACIPHFKVQEVLVKRWVPSQERESKADGEL